MSKIVIEFKENGGFVASTDAPNVTQEVLIHNLVNVAKELEQQQQVTNMMSTLMPQVLTLTNPPKGERLLEAVKGKVKISYEKYLEMRGVMEIPAEIVVEPTYMTEKAVGADCFASEDVIIPAGKVKVVPTGIKAKFNGEDEGLFPFIRSSIPKKKGLILANGVGVIEEDYYGNPDNDGNIGFMFWNMSDEDVTIERFERVGQIVLMPILRFDNAGKAGMTRGESGSTGK